MPFRQCQDPQAPAPTICPLEARPVPADDGPGPLPYRKVALRCLHPVTQVRCIGLAGEGPSTWTIRYRPFATTGAGLLSTAHGRNPEVPGGSARQRLSPEATYLSLAQRS